MWLCGEGVEQQCIQQREKGWGQGSRLVGRGLQSILPPSGQRKGGTGGRKCGEGGGRDVEEEVQGL